MILSLHRIIEFNKKVVKYKTVCPTASERIPKYFGKKYRHAIKSARPIILTTKQDFSFPIELSEVVVSWHSEINKTIPAAKERKTPALESLNKSVQSSSPIEK